MKNVYFHRSSLLLCISFTELMRNFVNSLNKHRQTKQNCNRQVKKDSRTHEKPKIPENHRIHSTAIHTIYYTFKRQFRSSLNNVKTLHISTDAPADITLNQYQTPMTSSCLSSSSGDEDLHMDFCSIKTCKYEANYSLN